MEKNYDELNRYEKAMTHLSLEQRLENMARDLMQIAKVLQVSVHVDATFHDWDEKHASAAVFFIKGEEAIRRDVNEDGDLIGIIDEMKE